MEVSRTAPGSCTFSPSCVDCIWSSSGGLKASGLVASSLDNEASYNPQEEWLFVISEVNAPGSPSSLAVSTKLMYYSKK